MHVCTSSPGPQNTNPTHHTHQNQTKQVIWGTTYPILTFVKRFRRFIRNFTLPRPANNGGNEGGMEEEGEQQEQEPHYIALLKGMRRTQVGL